MDHERTSGPGIQGVREDLLLGWAKNFNSKKGWRKFGVAGGGGLTALRMEECCASRVSTNCLFNRRREIPAERWALRSGLTTPCSASHGRSAWSTLIGDRNIVRQTSARSSRAKTFLTTKPPARMNCSTAPRIS